MQSRILRIVAWSIVLLPSAAMAQATDASLDAVTTLANMFRWTGMMASVVVVAAAWLLLRFITRVTEQLGNVFAERRLLLQKITAFLRFGIYFVTIVTVILMSFEISKQVLAILGGTAAVAIGFAIKDLVASLVAGVMIMFDRPFQVGDRVSFGGEYGDIINIGLRSVKLRTLSDSVVTIPNNMFVTDVTSCGNYGVLNMQVVVDVLIGIDQDVKRAQEIVREAAVSSCHIYLPNPVQVLVSQVVEEGYIALRLRLKAYVLDTKFEKAFETDVTLRVMNAFQKEGILPPAILHRQLDAAAAIQPMQLVG